MDSIESGFLQKWLESLESIKMTVSDHLDSQRLILAGTLSRQEEVKGYSQRQKYGNQLGDFHKILGKR